MSSPTDLGHDERLLIEEYRKAKQAKFADILISIDKGNLTKCDVTIKKRGELLTDTTRLRESNV